jgi:hypothetical protein
MPQPVRNNFLGYKPDVANPPPNSALAMQNVVIHRRRDPKTGNVAGWIEQAMGYAKKLFVTGGSNPGTLPGNDTVIRKISAIAYGDPYNLYIPDHGGQNVTVLLATYTKTAFFPASPTLDRFGVWIRPYWDGSAWIDEWYELTEMFIFEILALPAGDHLIIDDGTYGFATLDPGATVFKADYFKDWTIVYAAFTDTENYDLVRSSGWDTTNYYLQLSHANNDYTSRIVGTKIMVYRSFLPKELPSSLASQVRGLLSEIRLTSGNTASDVTLMAGYRNISFPYVGDTTPHSYTKSYDRVLADVGCLEMWQYAVVLGIFDKAGATDPILASTNNPTNTHKLKYSLVFDDGNESRVFDAFTEDSGGTFEWTHLSAGNSITLIAGHGIKINGLRSFGGLPPRSRYIRVYMDDNDDLFYRIIDIDLRDAATFTQPIDVAVLVETLGAIKHAWAASIDIDVTNTIWTSPGEVEATAQIGRAITDDGVIQYKAAAVVGELCFAIGVRKSGTLYPNHIFASLANGDGVATFDSFGLVALRMINVEYNDGDELLFDHPARDTLLAFKRRSVIVISQGSSSGGQLVFNRNRITKADGLCSERTVVDFEDVVYWAGYNGIYSFSSQGLVTLNRDWLEEWKAVDQTYKESAIATFDRTNRQYRLEYNGLERILDIDTGEWNAGPLTDQPARFAPNQKDGTVDFLSGNLIHTLGAGTRHDGANFAMEYMTNDEIASQLQNIDALLLDVRIEYASDVALTVTIYRDGVPQTPVALAAGNGSSLISAGLSFRCKRFRFKIVAATTGDNQTLVIKAITPRYQLIPAGISSPAFASEGAAAAIDQRPLTLADIRSGKYNLVANVLTTVPFSYPFSVAVGDNYSLKADVFNNANEWIMSVEASSQTRFDFDVTSPENGYVKYIAAAYQ